MKIAAELTERVLIQNPAGEGYINITPLINMILDSQDERKAENWPKALEAIKETLPDHIEDIQMNLDIAELDKVTYQNIISRNKMVQQFVNALEIVYLK